ncbi:hypothetical protein OG906_33785 [Streptomyces sp. NBC_01426]|nr:hypothetical protein [Streptomyces sp. NBC_01426]
MPYPCQAHGQYRLTATVVTSDAANSPRTVKHTFDIKANGC